MKRHLLLAPLIVFTIAASAQPTTTQTPTIKTDYLKKSKNQKTTAWILLGGGTLLSTVGVTVGFNEVVTEIGNIFSNEPQKTSNTGEVLFYTGLASMAGSIPFFIASSKNRKKANSISAFFKIENRPYVVQGMVIRTPYPALSVKIGI
jgi:hypothetical protein